MFRVTIARTIVAITIFVGWGVADAQGPTPADVAKHVGTGMQKMLSRPVGGISVAIAREGKVVFARGYGMANLEHSVAVAPETVFHIDSISKNIVAGVLLQLVDEGKLDLDDDVTRYIPNAHAGTQSHGAATAESHLRHL